MKNLIVIILISVVFAAKAYAQFPIPSYGVDVSMGTTTFEEGVSASNSVILNNYSLKKTENKVIMSAEEKSIKAKIENPEQNNPHWSIVYIYSIDGNDLVGPYTINQDEILSVDIDEREWGLKVVDSSIGCKLTVWIE